MSTAVTPALPPPPTPDTSAQAVPSVQQTTGEKVIGGIGSRAEAFAQGLSGLSGARPHDFSDSSVGKMLQQHYDARLAEARVNYNSAQQLLGILNSNVDPDTGQSLTPDKRAKYMQEANAAWGAYAKSAGVNKEAKAAVQQKGQLFQLALTHGIEAAHQIATKLGLAAPQGQAPGNSKVPPPPSASASSASSSSPSPPSPPSPQGPQASGSSPSATTATTPPAAGATPNPAVPPPPTGPSPRDAAMEVSRLSAETKDRHDIAMRQIQVDQDSAAKIQEAKAAAAAKGGGRARHLQHVNVTNPATGQTEPGSYDPDSGEYLDQQGNIIKGAQLAAKQISYKGPNDTPLMGWAIGDTLYDQKMNPLPEGTEKYIAWAQPRTTVTEGIKEVPQPDGSIALVPVETSSVSTRGTKTPSAPAPSTPAHVKGSGTTVGGKVPPGVTKAYEGYNAAQERYSVMQKALPEALKGDQQAMLNLLANHVGMTMGLQKGARITQGIYSEAEQSAPWLQRVGARFDKDGYLSGVVLTPEQMDQMIKLAKVRLDEDHDAWQREIGSAKQGYGMTPPPTPSGSGASAKKSGGPAPKTADEYLKSIGLGK